MEENNNLNNNQNNNENGNNVNPDQENKKPGFIKTNAKRVGGAAPVLAKIAVVGGTVTAATIAVLHKIGDSASEILEHVDSVKDAITEKGGDVVESIKDSLE